MLDWIKGLDAAAGIVGGIFGFSAFVVAWLTRPSRVNANKIEELQTVNAELQGRVSELEAVIANQPTRDDFHALTLKLSEMGGQISTVSTELQAVSRIAIRIDDFLLNQGGK